MRIFSGSSERRDLDRQGQSLLCSWKEISVPSSSGCPQTRFKHVACVLDNNVYILGGKDNTLPLKDFWSFHLGSGRWERQKFRGSPLPHLQGHTAVSYKREVIVFGGDFSSGSLDPSLWIINIDQQHIHQPSRDLNSVQPSSRRDHTAVLHCGIMYVYGGFVDLHGSSSELWGYHIDEDCWKLYTSSQSLETPGGRHGHSCVLYHNSMWIFGGLCDLSAKSELWSFNLLTQRWTRLKSVPGPPAMSGHSADVVEDQMVIIGGENQEQLSSDVWVYSFESNLWRKISLHNSIYQLSAVSHHASVCIVKLGEEARTENSARCFSEPALQEATLTVKASSSSTERPRTSPSSDSQVGATASEISASKWVYPVKSVRSEILSLCSVTSADFEGTRTVQQTPRISTSQTTNDQLPLLRFVSRESSDSVGVDNVLDCTADEHLTPPENNVDKMCSTTGLSDQTYNAKENCVNNLVHIPTVSSQRTVTPGCVNKTAAVLRTNSDKSTSGQSSRIEVSSLSVCEDPVISLSAETKVKAEQRSIFARSCNDMFIEDIEQQSNFSPELLRAVLNPRNQPDEKKHDWVEMDSFSSTSVMNEEDSRSNTTHDIALTSFGENVVQSSLNKELQVNSDKLDERDEHFRKVFVTVATQTGSNLDLRPSNCDKDKDKQEKKEKLLEDPPFILVFGGKISTGDISQQVLRVWRYDIHV